MTQAGVCLSTRHLPPSADGPTVMRRHATFAVGMALLLLVAGCTAGPGGGSDGATPENSTIQVAGTGSADAEPNQAVVRVAAVATASDAVTARRQLAENVSRMRTALREIGIEDDQIVTQRYDLGRDYRRPPREGAEPIVQYRAYHSFEITLSDIERVGTVVDTAIGNGATEVDDVQFTLSADRRQELERDARSAAMADAHRKARGLAGEANLTVTGVKVIRTGGGGGPRPYEGGAAMATETAAADTDIESGPVTVVATVNVVYEAVPADGSESGSA